MKLLVFAILLVLLADAAYAANATVAYRSSTGSCPIDHLNCPKIRNWDSAGSGSWGSEVELSTSGSPIREAVIKISPVSRKSIIVTQSDDGNLDAYVCGSLSDCGSAAGWTASNNIGTVWSAAPGTHSRRFDVQFESASGDALVVYAVESTNGSRDLAYKVLPAARTSFAGIAEEYIDDSGNATDLQYTWILLDRKPTSTSEELIVAGFDGNNSGTNAWVWNGTAWGNQVMVASEATGTGGNEALAVRYASDGSKGMVVSGNELVGVGNSSGQYWNGTGWTVANPGVLGGGASTLRWMSLKADPATDDLQLGVSTSLSEMTTSYWNGTAWSATLLIDVLIDTISQRSLDFDWDTSGTTGRLVWDTDGPGTALNEEPCSSNCPPLGASTVVTYAGTGAWLAMYRNPTDSDTVNILGLRLNSNFDIGSFSWDGIGFTNYGDAVITDNTTVITFEAFTLDFQPSALSVCEIIESSGSYSLSSNVAGASLDASELPLGLGSACMKITSSNVIFDCNGLNMTNNGTAGTTYGIILNGSLTNVTVKNCPGISQYSHGIFVQQSNNSLFANNTAHNNTGTGFFLNLTNNLTLSNNSAFNNTQNGFALSSSNSSALTNNSAYNNSGNGFLILANSLNNTLGNNSAFNNTLSGFNLTSSANNTMANNTAHKPPARVLPGQQLGRKHNFQQRFEQFAARLSAQFECQQHYPLLKRHAQRHGRTAASTFQQQHHRPLLFLQQHRERDNRKRVQQHDNRRFRGLQQHRERDRDNKLDKHDHKPLAGLQQQPGHFHDEFRRQQFHEHECYQ